MLSRGTIFITRPGEMGDRKSKKIMILKQELQIRTYEASSSYSCTSNGMNNLNNFDR